MWKPLILIAVMANTFFITPSEATCKICPKNEVYDKCPAPCPPRECGVNIALILCAPSPKPGDPDCKPGCRCADGYLRNRAGDCIPEDQCKYDCPKNETLDPCYSPCPPRYCGVNIAAVSCLATTECEPGCRCCDGYLRNGEGICVLEKDCPKCTKPNEIYDVCPAPCPPRRCDVDERLIKCAAPPKPGDPECKPGCRCAGGYVRSPKGICVTRDQCPPVCGKDEVYSACINRDCRPKNCSQLGRPILYPKIEPSRCIKGCLCREGFVRAANGTCIPKEKCPPVCGDNEVYSECINGGCQAKNCSQLGKPIPCVRIDPKYCIKGCLCAEGYLRARNGTCVPEDQCDNCNKPHEHYDPCAQECPPETCDSIGGDYDCPKPPPNCQGACRCDKGYFRNKIGECITKKECLKCRGPYEYFSCGGACDNVCATLYKQNQTNCPIINVKCNPMCYCEKGYARNKNNICIPINKCPAPICGKNERFIQCPPGLCAPKTCSDLGYPVPCADLPEGAGCPEPPACLCNENYVRDANGKCIPQENCPPVCGDNEVYSECINGGCQAKNCSQLGKPIPCVRIDPKYCIKGCLCAEGYLRARNGTCVPEDQCDNCNKPHEHYDPCAQECPPETCDSIGVDYDCPKPPPNCKGACRCDKGYFRNKIGECITKKECLKCTGPYEYFSCGGACDNVCATLYKQNQTNCPIINIKCNPMCYCEKGYARDDKNICIPIDQCPAPVCGINEVYDTCANGGCQKRNCSQVGEPTLCIDPIQCNGGCVCQEGFLRTKEGTCVPQDQCPLKCTGPNEYYSCGGACDNVCATLSEQNQTHCPIINKKCNPKCYCYEGYARDVDNICIPIKQCGAVCRNLHEVYSSCPSTCPPQTCESLGRAYVCPTKPGEEPPCQPGCICEEGYYRNKIGDCTSEADCLKCMGPHEFFSCGGACDNVCATLNEQNQTNCPIINIQCNRMCYCEDGYARNDNNICIPIKDCPAPTNTTTPVNVTEARARLDKGSIILAGEFLYQLISSKPDENCVVSATSVMIPLAQLAIWTEKLVLEQLLKLLNLNNKDEIRSVFLELTTSYANQQNVVFEVANKYYANERYPLSTNFKRESKEYFDSYGENLDFEKNDEAAVTINEWVKNRTDGRIEDLVTADMLSAATRLVIVNAIYFLGDWVHQFNANNTETKDFYKRDGETVPVEIMYQKNSFNYAENDIFQALEMLYKGNNFSCLFILPRKIDGLLETAEFLRDPAEFSNMYSAMKYEQVRVYLPKMKITSQLDMGEMLKKANVTAMFDPDNDSIHGLLEKEEPLYVSDVVQKAFVLIDEKGTEAAAATAIGLAG